MKTSRGLSGALVAIMASTLLGGCFLLPEAESGLLLTTESDLQAADDMYAHVAKLNGLDGINASYDGARRENGSLVFSHEVTIEAQDASKADLTWAIVTTWLAFLEPNVSSQAVHLRVAAGPKGEFDVMRWEDGGSELTEDQLTFEVQYWLDFGGVVHGPVYDSISLGWPGEGYFRSTGTLDSLVDFDYEALYQLPELANGPSGTSYSICGVSSSGGLPSIGELRFGAQLQRLIADAPEGTAAQIRIGLSSTGQPYAQANVSLGAFDVSELDSHENWPFVLEFAALFSAPPGDEWVGVLHVAPQLESSDGQVNATFGLCATDLVPREADTAFFELFADEVLPDGSQGGACVRF